jgi:hypothetical protein
MRGKKKVTRNEGHAHLYIAVGLLVVFAVVFFVNRIEKEKPTAVQVNTNPPPPGPVVQMITLTPEQQKMQDEIIASRKVQKVKLTREQAEAQNKILEQMGIALHL